MLISNAIDSFIVACQADGLAKSTVKHYESKLGRLARALGDQPLDDISTDTLRRYIIGMREQTERYIDAPQKPAQAGGYSSESVNTHIRALHRFFKWCSAEYDIPNPMAKIRYPQPQKQAPKGISPAEIIKLLEATGDNLAGIRDRALVAFLADTGCRMGGLVNLTIHDLYLARNQAIVLEKGNLQRMVNYTNFTKILLEGWLACRPDRVEQVFTSMNTEAGLTHSGIALILKRLKKEANLSGRANAHAFRHGFAREFLMNGGDISVLAKLLGHKDTNTTAVYYAVFTQDELSKMHAQFSPLNRLND